LRQAACRLAARARGLAAPECEDVSPTQAREEKHPLADLPSHGPPGPRYIVSVSCRPFISYAKEDGETAERLHDDLCRLGADPWLDRHALRGGEPWKQAIREALRNSTHVLALISARSVTKTGFVQNELRQALELLDSVPPEKIFIIPIRLDNSIPRHERLNDLHWIDLFPEYENGLKRIAESLDLAPESSARPGPFGSRVRAIFLTAIVLGGAGLGFHYISKARAEPEVISDSRVLYPDGRRGSEAAIGVTIPARASVLLTFSALEDPAAYQDYRVDLLILR
jgi:hypothetical protein